ncbi:lipoprotein insertase outer membrane protein LolB [Legionella geestiana]|uniref:lipoprotein insertase outer membrane protein LolB n=2 Tax=Legionella geestiana TaxID=45065 RepID=UPI00048E52AB|nr:lipoprotein insertase outer membrane protein LolB [Legionella geestiana]QBS12003.1 outer membrane lipoprotein LolB [Legionella geestiana]STX53280.1 molecular chaperone LolB [Legionella geestiana]
MRIARPLTLVAAIAIAIALAACAPRVPTSETTPNALDATTEKRSEAEAPEGAQSRAPARDGATLSAFEINGAMAARNGKKGWSASVNWVQRGPADYQIRLMGPLGGGTVIITRAGGLVTLQDGRKKVSDKNADALLARETGVRLPVPNLYYWVRGLPAPGAVHDKRYDAAHHLVFLQQAGYTIEYKNFTTVNGVDVPLKMQLIGHGLVVKLAVRRWSGR